MLFRSGVEVPGFIIKAVEDSSGLTPVYHEIGYRKCLLFSLRASVPPANAPNLARRTEMLSSRRSPFFD